MMNWRMMNQEKVKYLRVNCIREFKQKYDYTEI